MNLQYITDGNGQTTGVFIPINEWNALKEKFKGIEEQGVQIPEWQQQVVKERIEIYHANKKHLDFDASLDDIENQLDP
jgi:hypothetical protein